MTLNVPHRLCETRVSNPSYNLKRDSNTSCGVKTINQDNWSYYEMLNWKLLLPQKGRHEVQRWNRGGAYILQELDGIVLKNGAVVTFWLLPYITRDHWFMRTGWMGPDSGEEESDSSTDSEEMSDTSEGE